MSIKSKVLITIGVLVGIFLVAVLIIKDRDILPNAPLYPLKLSGEWLDVNFLTFGAPEKQAKHLQLADRRLREFLQTTQSGSGSFYAGAENRRYETELARAEFMAEQLALLDHKFISSIEQVYLRTLKNLEDLNNTAGNQTDIAAFRRSAQIYNSRAIKTLIQKYTYSDSDRLHYVDLVRVYLDQSSKNSNLNAEQKQRLEQAREVLLEGKEIEWAYDLSSSVK